MCIRDRAEAALGKDLSHHTDESADHKSHRQAAAAAGRGRAQMCIRDSRYGAAGHGAGGLAAIGHQCNRNPAELLEQNLSLIHI